eukprot:Colp12_sorted_trinity150504_noHs@11392
MLGRCATRTLRSTIKLKVASRDCRFGKSSHRDLKKVDYEQGSIPADPNYKRQYFYFVDHHGQLFLDDVKIKNFTSCFKEVKFLDFFYRRLRPNTTKLYEEDFPYISPCGRELNFIRVDDTPIVFLKLIDDNLLYGGSLTVPFQPDQLHMSSEGRIYHPSPICGPLALVKSALALELEKNFEYGDDGDVWLKWKGGRYKIIMQE